MSLPSVGIVDQLSSALSARSLQHEVIVSNIANRDAHGYRRLHVKFDAALDSARIVAEDGPAAPVSMERDLVSLSVNSVQYQALANATSRYFDLLSLITNPNRG